MGELESIRIGDDLQENVVLVEDVGQLRVPSVIGHDLQRGKSSVKNGGVSANR